MVTLSPGFEKLKTMLEQKHFVETADYDMKTDPNPGMAYGAARLEFGLWLAELIQKLLPLKTEQALNTLDDSGFIKGSQTNFQSQVGQALVQTLDEIDYRKFEEQDFKAHSTMSIAGLIGNQDLNSFAILVSPNKEIISEGLQRLEEIIFVQALICLHKKLEGETDEESLNARLQIRQLLPRLNHDIVMNQFIDAAPDDDELAQISFN